MDIIVEIMKFLGAVVAAAAAIAGTYLDGTKSVDSGALTRRGRIIVGSAFAGVILSGFAQIVQMIDSRASAEATRLRNEETASRLEQIPRLIMRQSYPIEPLELFFSIELPMDQPQFQVYSDRVQKDIVAYLRESRGDRGPTSDNLADEDVVFVISSRPEWLPRETEQERAALSLVSDNTRFDFVDPLRKEVAKLSLLSTSPDIQEVIVTMPRRGVLKQHIELTADFKRRVFIKVVRCENPVRAGTGITSFSALDLVGRTLIWEDGLVTPLKWKLTSLYLRFSYDYGFGQSYDQLPAGRAVEIAASGSVVISADDIGLDFLMNQ